MAKQKSAWKFTGQGYPAELISGNLKSNSRIVSVL